MKQSSWAVRVATLGPIGYMYAPGTVATFITMPFAYAMATSMPSCLYALGIILFIVISYFIINRALDFFKGDQDPSQIVLDEFLGCLVTFYAVPINAITLIAGFALFRLFDITKWFGISKAERLIGALGVIADDFLAGILANILVRVAYYLITGTL